MREAIYSCADHAMRRAFGDVRCHYGSALSIGRGSSSGLEALDLIAQDAMTTRLIVFALPEWAVAMVVTRYAPTLEQTDRAAMRAAEWLLNRGVVEADAVDVGFIAWCVLHWAEKPRRAVSAGEWRAIAGISPWRQRVTKSAVKRACVEAWSSVILPRVEEVLASRGLIDANVTAA